MTNGQRRSESLFHRTPAGPAGRLPIERSDTDVPHAPTDSREEDHRSLQMNMEPKTELIGSGLLRNYHLTCPTEWKIAHFTYLELFPLQLSGRVTCQGFC